MGDFVARAEAALKTGQPQLAGLYMRRALSDTAAGRSWLLRLDFLLAVERTGRDMAEPWRNLAGMWGWPAMGETVRA